MEVWQKIHQFWRWWLSTLLSCLPETWLQYLTTLRTNFDLVVTRRGDTVFLLNKKGSIIDSIDLGSQLSPSKPLSVESEADGEYASRDLSAAENLVPDQDPPVSLNQSTLDIVTTNQAHQHNDTSLDITLNEDLTVFDENEPQSGLDSQAEINNVVALSRNNNDITVQVDYQEKTETRMDTAFNFGQETTIINEKQGNLLRLDATTSDARETTQLFRNDGGRIRRVDAQEDDITESDSFSSEQAVSKAANENLAEYNAVIRLLEKHQGSKNCLYLLPENRVLVLNLSYPIEVVQNIENVLTYDLEKHIPLSFKEIRYFYALQCNEQHKQVNVEVAVIRSEEYDVICLSLSRFIKNGLFCTTENFLQKYGRKINFLNIEAENNWLSVLKFRNIHLTLNLVLLIALLLVPPTILYQRVEQQVTNTPAEIEKVKRIIGSFNDLDNEIKFRTHLFEHINRSPKAVELLTELSRNINSDAWLGQFSLKNGEIKLKGEALSATSVSDDLSSTGLFKSIRFVSSIVKNPQSGKETFELLMVLNSDE